MDINISLAPIVGKINDLFSDEVGPVSSILCEESKEKWCAGLQAQGQRQSLRTLSLYINMLAKHIDDQENKKLFVDNVYAIEALSILEK